MMFASLVERLNIIYKHSFFLCGIEAILGIRDLNDKKILDLISDNNKNGVNDSRQVFYEELNLR